MAKITNYNFMAAVILALLKGADAHGHMAWPWEGSKIPGLRNHMRPRNIPGYNQARKSSDDPDLGPGCGYPSGGGQSSANDNCPAGAETENSNRAQWDLNADGTCPVDLWDLPACTTWENGATQNWVTGGKVKRSENGEVYRVQNVSSSSATIRNDDGTDVITVPAAEFGNYLYGSRRASTGSEMGMEYCVTSGFFSPGMCPGAMPVGEREIPSKPGKRSICAGGFANSAPGPYLVENGRRHNYLPPG